MMKLVALGLLIASLAGASVFSPTSTHHNTEKTNIREGHGVVVVEYDQNGHHNTKISITPDQLQPHDEKFTDGGDYSGLLGNAKDKIKEAASVLPNMGQGLSQDSHDAGAFLHAPKELICDAYGKCKKHKIVGAMGKAKETAQEIVAEKKEAAREVGEIVADAVGKVKDTVSHTARDVQEKAKVTLKEAKDTGKTLRNDVARNVSEAVKNVASYLGSRERNVDYVMGVGNLMGFAMVYGLCVWDTFISSYVLSRAMLR